jgi:hypothetical protein
MEARGLDLGAPRSSLRPPIFGSGSAAFVILGSLIAVAVEVAVAVAVAVAACCMALDKTRQFFFGELAGTFTQCTNVIPKLHPRH